MTRSRTPTTVAFLGLLAIVFGVLLLSDSAPVVEERRAERPRIIAEVPVTPMQLSLAASNNSPSLVADPTDERFVALANRLDAPDFGCALQVSGDGGTGWRTVQPVRQLPTGADKCYAPEIAFDSSGKLYYLFVGLHGEGNEPMGAFLATSVDRGQSFSAPRRVLGPLNFAVRMAIDPTVGGIGRMHLAWIKANSDPPTGGFGPPPNPIMSAYSDDGGKRFSPPVQVSDARRERVVAPALALGPDRSVHVAYYDLQKDAIDYQGLEGEVWEGNWSVVLASSHDGGASFGPGVEVEDSVVPPERVMLIFTMPPPALAVAGDRRCLAWTDSRRGDPDVLLRCSPRKGAPWSPIVRLNDDPIGNGRSQYLPRLSVSPTGRLDAVFYDRRLDPLNVLNDVAFTSSDDGGRSFGPTIKLTSDVSNSRIGQQYVHAAAKDQFEFGSRLALLSKRNGALAAWTDTRNSRQAATGQDIFAAAVDLPSEREQWVVPAGAALTGGGALVVLAAVVQRRRKRSRHERPTEEGDEPSSERDEPAPGSAEPVRAMDR